MVSLHWSNDLTFHMSSNRFIYLAGISGVLNVLEGADGEIDMHCVLTEGDLPIGGNARNATGKDIPSSAASQPAAKPVISCSLPKAAAAQPTEQVTQRFPMGLVADDVHPSDEIRRALSDEDGEVMALPYVRLKDILGSQLPPGVDQPTAKSRFCEKTLIECLG
jgi:hypothetical protein